MNHDEVALHKLTESYFLDELDPDKREEFEEHYFDCPECALDVRAASVFVEQSKTLLAESVSKAARPVPAAVARGWFGWFPPGLAIAAVALLLAVIGYQNLVVYPHSHSDEALNRPQILPWASINTRTRGSSRPVVAARRGGTVLLLVNIPPDSRYSRYIAELYNPAGTLEWSLAIPSNMADDVFPVQVPGTNREAGIYALALLGITPAGQSSEISRTPFELQIQK
jgi:anti-sigma factor RsiW